MEAPNQIESSICCLFPFSSCVVLVKVVPVVVNVVATACVVLVASTCLRELVIAQ